MSPPGQADTNPYKAPSEVSQPAHPPVSPENVDPDLVKKFRQQIHALGAFWILIGGLVAAVAAAGIWGDMDILSLDRVGIALVGLLGVMGTSWIVLGVLTCLKHMWAVYAGLVLSYLSVLAQVFALNICGLVIFVVVILQAHRVISWAKRMREAGFALTARS